MPDITLPPVLIDTSVQESAQISTEFPNPYNQGPFKVGLNLYCVLQAQVGAPRTVNVFKSTDDGLTWTQMDAGNSPSFTDSTCRVQARLNPNGTTITIAYNPASTTGPTTLSWRAFNCLTDTFDVAGTIPNYTNNDIRKGTGLFSFDFTVRVSGDIVLVFGQVIPPNTLQVSMGYVIFSGAAWGLFVTIAAGNDGTQSGWQIPAVVLDEVTAIIHIFLQFIHIPAGRTDDYYISLSGTNVASVAIALSARAVTSRISYGSPVVSQSQDSVTLPVYSHIGSTFVFGVYTGTPLSAPVFGAFTQLDTGALALPGDFENGHAMIVDDDIWAVWIFWPDVATIQLKRAINTAGVWAASDIFYDLIANPPNANLDQLILGGNCAKIGSVGAIITVNDAADATQVAYFLRQAVIPPPPTPTPRPKGAAGGGTFFPRFLNGSLLEDQITRGPAFRTYAPLYWLFDFPNAFDLCLSREWRLYNEIDPQALSCARKPDCFEVYAERQWVEPPPGAVTFNPNKAIPLPDPATVNAVVLSFRVPIAYDGIILAQYHSYRGSGAFVEASGDIIWRVRVNGRYLRDMGDMEVSLGSPQKLSPCPGGLWVYSGNLVEYLVSAPNGSGALPLPGQGNILAGLHGWFWPRK